jgi:hypothetical protein
MIESWRELAGFLFCPAPGGSAGIVFGGGQPRCIDVTAFKRHLALLVAGFDQEFQFLP